MYMYMLVKRESFLDSLANLPMADKLCLIARVLIHRTQGLILGVQLCKTTHLET